MLGLIEKGVGLAVASVYLGKRMQSPSPIQNIGKDLLGLLQAPISLWSRANQYQELAEKCYIENFKTKVDNRDQWYYVGPGVVIADLINLLGKNLCIVDEVKAKGMYTSAAAVLIIDAYLLYKICQVAAPLIKGVWNCVSTIQKTAKEEKKVAELPDSPVEVVAAEKKMVEFEKLAAVVTVAKNLMQILPGAVKKIFEYGDKTILRFETEKPLEALHQIIDDKSGFSIKSEVLNEAEQLTMIKLELVDNIAIQIVQKKASIDAA